MLNHFDGTSEVPQTLFSTGHWRAERVLNWEMAEGDNPYGVVVAGVLDVEVRLFAVDGPEEGVLATLRIICNVPAAGVFTGLPEGIFVDSVDGVPFEPTLIPTDPAAPGPPQVPLGVTTFNLARVR